MQIQIRPLLARYIGKPENGQDTFFLVSMSLTCSVLICFLMYSAQSFELHRFTGRAIGLAILEGTDPAKRGDVFYLLCIASCAIFSILYVAFSALLRGLKRYNAYSLTSVERSVATSAALVSMPCLVMSILKFGSPFAVLTLWGVVLLAIGMMLVKFVFAVLGNTRVVAALCKYHLLVALGLAMVALQFFVAAIGAVGPVSLVNPGTLAVLAGTIGLIAVAGALQLRLVEKRVVWACVPVVCIPLALPLSCEFQYWLTKYSIVTYNSIFIGISCVLIVTALFLYKIHVKRLDSKTLIAYGYFPIILLTVSVFAVWHSEVTILTDDLLHTGNGFVPVQQLFKYGVWPYIGYWPAQGVQVAIEMFLYSLVYGHADLSSFALLGIVWGSCHTLLVYLLLARFFDPFLSLASALLLPLGLSTGWITPYYSFGIIPALLLPWVMEKTTVKRLLLLWLTALATFLWMPSAGKSVYLGLFCLLAIRALGNPLAVTKRIVVSFVAFHVPLLLLYVFLVSITGASVLDTLKLIYAYSAVDANIGSYPVLAVNKISLETMLYYFVTPFALLVICLQCFYRGIFGVKITSQQWIIYLLAVFSLLTGMRSLYRHCLLEAYYPLFSLFVALVVAFLWRTTYVRRKVVFIACALLFSFFLPFSLPPSITFFPYQWNSPRPSRITIKDDGNAQAVAAFLNSALGEDQTFLDLINGHFLYALTGRKFPLFHHSTQLVQSDMPQAIYVRQLGALYRSGKIPLVVANGPFWGSKIDGIPSTMSLYKISEFLYQNYRPLVSINGYDIWAAVNSDISRELDSIQVKGQRTIASILDCGQIASTSDAHAAMTTINDEAALKVVAGKNAPQVCLDLRNASVPVVLGKNKYYFVRYRLRSNHTGHWKTYYTYGGQGYSEQHSSESALDSFENLTTMYASLPLHAEDVRLDSLRFDPPKGTSSTIEHIEVIETDQPAYTRFIDSMPQHYDMKKLPYIWANYDSKNALTSAVVLENNIATAPVATGRHFVLNGFTNIDKSTGNYIRIRLQASQKGIAVLRYGEKSPSSVSFYVVPSPGVTDYLIRISSQWAWYDEDVQEMTLDTDGNVEFYGFSVLKGD